MYRRQIELIGKENQEILSQKSVLIVGAGGLGNSIASTISCIGLKEIHIIDFDKVEEHNLHRQFQFTREDIGKYKAEVLAKKISRCKEKKYYVKFYNQKLNKNLKKQTTKKIPLQKQKKITTQNNSQTHLQIKQNKQTNNSYINQIPFEKIDLIFDATDNFETRKTINEISKKFKIPWIYASVDEWYGQVGILKNLDFFNLQNSQRKGQFPPLINLVGSIASTIGIKALLGEIKEILYYIDFKNDLEIKKFTF